MTNQPNKTTVKDGLPTAEEVLKSKVPSALYNSGNCYVGHALDAMQEYSDQQNAGLMSEIERWKALYELGKKSIRELIKANEKLESVESENAGLRERVKELEAGLAYSIRALKAVNSFGATKPIIEDLENALKK